MARIPRVYRTGGQIVTTQGIQDLSSGRNRVDLYCGRSLSGASQFLGEYRFSVANPMSNIAFRSHNVSTSLGVPNDPRGLEFEIPFESTQIIEGDTIVQMPWSLPTSVASSGAVLMTLMKVDSDGTATGLVSGSTRTIYGSSGETFSGASVKMVMPRTKFKRGEAFRLRLNLRPQETTPVNIYHDPFNGSVTGAPFTNLIVQTPFDFPK